MLKSKKPNPIFIIGHKRSGSTHLARILNMHPGVYVSNETDILWLLYQKSRGQEYKKYSLDGSIGMKKSLNTYSEIINSEKKIDDIFYEFLNATMNDGFKFFEGVHKPNVRYVGDQKPFQNADPQLMEFAKKELPTSYYIHIIRHPIEVIRSCKEFGKNKDGGTLWKNISIEQILRRWLRVENWISKAQKSGNYKIIHIRYEDLIQSPKVVSERMFKFLKVNYDDVLLNKIKDSIIYSEKENKFQLPKLNLEKKIMDKYGYEYC